MSDNDQIGANASASPSPENGPDTQQAGTNTKKGGTSDVLPAPTFTTFVMSLASSALVQLGEVPEPETGKVQQNLVVAKHTIDIISMLQEKIDKGLDADERRLLDGLLYELRLQYVMKNK